jgi:hypothetical protein
MRLIRPAEFLASIPVRTAYVSARRRPHLVKCVPREREPASGLHTVRFESSPDCHCAALISVGHSDTHGGCSKSCVRCTPREPLAALVYSTASLCRERTKELRTRSHSAAPPPAPRTCYMRYITQFVRRSAFPKRELWTRTLVVRPRALSCTRPRQSTCTTTSHSACPNSETHSHSGRTANQILPSDSSRCVALSGGDI